jgi:cell division protein FtsW
MQGARPERRAKKKKKSILGKLLNKKDRAKITVYKGGIDRWFLILVIIMVCVGTAMIFSASYVNALSRYGDSYFFVKKQLITAAVGIVCMIGATYLANYNFIKKIALPFFFAVLILNYATPFFGRTIQGGHRWIVIAGIQFQPSELLKLAVVFLFAWYISKMNGRMREFKWGILIPCGIISIIAVGMYLQQHFSGLIIITLICIAIIFIGEAPWQWLAGFGAVGFAGVSAIIMFTSYASSRVTSWLNPWSDPTGDGFQIIQSLYAIASGGLTGVGLGESRQKYLYLPEPQNDFIFSITSAPIKPSSSHIIENIKSFCGSGRYKYFR